MHNISFCVAQTSENKNFFLRSRASKMSETKAPAQSAKDVAVVASGGGGDGVLEWRWYHIGTVYALYLPPREMRQPMVQTSTLRLSSASGMPDAPERSLDRRSPRDKAKEDPRDRDVCIIHYDWAQQLVARFRKERAFAVEALRCNVYFKSSKLTPEQFVSLLGRELLFAPAGPVLVAHVVLPSCIPKEHDAMHPPTHDSTVKIDTASLGPPSDIAPDAKNVLECDRKEPSVGERHVRCCLKTCRVPCGEMNRVCAGLFKAMKGNKAGQFMRVMQGDGIAIGDQVYCRMSADIASMYRLDDVDIRADLDSYVEIGVDNAPPADAPQDEKGALP